MLIEFIFFVCIFFVFRLYAVYFATSQWRLVLLLCKLMCSFIYFSRNISITAFHMRKYMFLFVYKTNHCCCTDHGICSTLHIPSMKAYHLYYPYFVSQCLYAKCIKLLCLLVINHVYPSVCLSVCASV